MRNSLGASIRITIVSIVLLGLIYPLLLTGIAQALFPEQANGSLVSVNGKIVGSWIVGQQWSQARYFHGRPSAAGKGYDPTSTGGTNLGPSSTKLMTSTAATIARIKKENPGASGPPPIDLVTSSGSGIDPDISPEAAYWEAPRVAEARRMTLGAVNALVAAHVRGRQFGFLGEPRVNVLEVNLALDGLHPR